MSPGWLPSDSFLSTRSSDRDAVSAAPKRESRWGWNAIALPLISRPLVASAVRIVPGGVA